MCWLCDLSVKVYFDENGSYPGAESLLNTYTYTFYWSTLTLAMMGDVLSPRWTFTPDLRPLRGSDG